MNITTKKTIEKCPFTSLIPEPPKNLNAATFFVVSIIEKGEGDILFYKKNGKSFTSVHVTESSCVIIPPFKSTVHKNFDKNSFMQRNIHIDESTFKECCDLIDPSLFSYFMFKDVNEAFKLTSPASIYIAECCSLITGENNKYFENIHKSVVCAILSSFLQNKMKNNSFPVWIRELLRGLNNPDFLLLSIEEMVKTTNYSHGYVNREFKKYLGMPLKQYVLKRKLDISASMLVTSDLSMQEIVDKLDFSNVSNFINIFKSFYKTTPAKYRKVNSRGISLDHYQEWGNSVLDTGENKIT